jgi:asparagine synthase (glutamine-hydrolysing)
VWDLVRRDKVQALLTRDQLPNSESKLLFNILCTKLFLEETGA